MTAGIIQIVVGIVAIVFGFLADAFYPAFMRRPKPDEKPMPIWLGRTVCVVVGAGFIYSGLSQWLPIQVGVATQGIFLIFVGLAVITYDLIADRIYSDPTRSQRARWAGRIVTFVVAVGSILAGVSFLRRH